MKKCERCEEVLEGRQERWCSTRCSKLGLKALYRKRNRDKLYAYKNAYRKAADGKLRPMAWPAKKRSASCLRCGTNEDLQGAHVKPLWAGGTHDTVVTFCRKHHHEFDELLRGFWTNAPS